MNRRRVTLGPPSSQIEGSRRAFDPTFCAGYAQGYAIYALPFPKAPRLLLTPKNQECVVHAVRSHPTWRESSWCLRYPPPKVDKPEETYSKSLFIKSRAKSSVPGDSTILLTLFPFLALSHPIVSSGISSKVTASIGSSGLVLMACS